MNFSKENLKNNRITEILKKYWIPIAIVFVCILVLISILGIYNDEILESDPGVELENGNGLFLAAGEIDSLNPVISASEDTYYLSKLIYDGLFEYDSNFNVKTQLVKSYTTDAETGTITINLRNGVKFHDGSKLKAEDVQFTINAIKAYGKRGAYFDKVSKISTVVVDGDLQLTIKFKNNKNGTLDDLVFPIVSSSTHASLKAFVDDDKNFKPVGTGKYRVSKYDHLKNIILKPNKSYFRSVANQDITVQILPNKEYASKLLETYSVTCYVTDSVNRKNIVADNDYKMYDIVSNDVDFIVYNVKKGIFTNKIARQAAAYSIDVEKIIQNGYMNDGVYSDNLYYPGFLGVAPDTTVYKYNLETSEKKFAEAGFTDKDSNGLLEDTSGKEINVTILVNEENANRIAAANIISRNLRNSGISNKIVSLPWKDYVSQISRKNYDILITGYEMNPNFDLRFLFNGKTKWGYKNSLMLEKATELERLHKAEEYSALYKELRTLMLDELPYYTLCYRKMGLIGVEYFEASELPTFDNIYHNSEGWTWKKPVKSE